MSRPFGLAVPLYAITEEARRVEVLFAGLRAAIACWLLASAIESVPGYSWRVPGFLSLFLAYSCVILILVRYRRSPGNLLAWTTELADLFWAFSIATGLGARISPLPLWLLVILTAAWRWGLMGALSTAGAASVLSFFSDALLLSGRPRALVDLQRTTAFLVAGLLLAYLLGDPRERQAEEALMSQIRTVARSLGEEKFLTEGLSAVLHCLRAEQAILVVGSMDGSTGSVWRTSAGDHSGEAVLDSAEFGPSERQRYFFSSPGEAWCALGREPRTDPAFSLEIFVLGPGGRSERGVARTTEFPRSAIVWNVERSMLAASLPLGDQHSGRIYLFEPDYRHPERQLPLLKRLAEQLGPAIYSHCILRSNSEAAERSALARELHDGPVQVLTALEMRIELLLRQASLGGHLQSELAEVQQLLREQILEVRDFMHRLRAGRIGPRELPGYLASYVERFSLETGIVVDFAAECETIEWSQNVCQEVARIVQEALVNVRKHSGAKHARVRLAREAEQWKLLIADDGRGFGFEGRLTQAELEATGRLPLVLSERVRAIRGSMTVESSPGRGATLEIAIPAKT